MARYFSNSGTSPPTSIAHDEPKILDLIVSKNLARRQLSAGQKALMALEYELYYAEATKDGRPIGDTAKSATTDSKKTHADLHESPWERQSVSRAAKAVGASGRAVAQAKAVQRDAPDLAEQVRAGHIALDAADKQRKERPDLRREPATGVSRGGLSDALRGVQRFSSSSLPT